MKVEASGTPRRRFAGALLLSGFAALTYQVAWERVLSQIIGSDAVSVTLVVTIFMICLGLGSWLSGRLVERQPARAIRFYALIEVVVGLYGVLSIPLLRRVNEQFAGGSLGRDFALNLLLLAPPIIGMGLTTPLIVHVAKQQLQNVGRTVGALYGCNIAGAAIGSAVTGLVLVEAVGLTGSTRIAAGLNVAAALVAVSALRSAGPGESIEPEPAAVPEVAPALGTPARVPRPAAVAAVCFGFGTLAIQVLFFRVLSNYLTLSPIVFPMLLCAYLCLMSIGQWVGGALADRFATRLVAVVAGLFAVGSVLFLGALRFPDSWAAALGAFRFSSFNGQLVARDYPQLIGDPNPFTVFFFSLLLMVSVIAWAGLFPVMFRVITQRIEDAGNRFASMYTLYTVGNVVGAFSCGFLMLPWLGTGTSALVTVLIVAVGVVVLNGRRAREGSPRRVVLLAAVGIVAALLMPRDYYRSLRLGDYRVTDVFEGRTGVATVVPTSRFYTIIDMNRTASASALHADPGPGDQYEAWRWNHTDVMSVDPAFRPRTILVIGIGHAYLIDAMLDLPFVEKITVVDISSEVVDAVKKYTTTSTKRIFTDPRVDIVIADGRRYVQSAVANGEKFDLIQNKINEPWHAGSSNLFTEEFFAQEQALLSPGGYLSTRPLTGHLTDGLKVFGNAIWGGGYHMYFKNGEFRLPSEAVVTPDLRKAWLAELPGVDPIAPVLRPTTPITVFTEVPDELRTDPNTDDRPTFEYYFLRKLLDDWVSPRRQLGDVDLARYTTQVPVRYQ